MQFVLWVRSHCKCCNKTSTWYDEADGSLTYVRSVEHYLRRKNGTVIEFLVTPRGHDPNGATTLSLSFAGYDDDYRVKR